ncbi:hypothetical protein JCM10908_003927 [Rhodotorula pacifica]|uniref:uncharacterized protein n=1 Tax=Rhodotorula pacifica TaxID=1495444 RepID=UPI00317243AD
MVLSERTRTHPRQDKPLKGATVRLKDRRSSRERHGLEAELDALRSELASEKARNLELSKGVCRIEGGSGAALIRALQKELAEKDDKLRESEALREAAICERDELASRPPRKEAPEPVPPPEPAEKPQPLKPAPPIPTPDPVHAYLIEELRAAELRTRELEADVQDLERKVQEKEELLVSASDRVKVAQQATQEVRETLRAERKTAASKLRTSLATAAREADEQREAALKVTLAMGESVRSRLREVLEVRLTYTKCREVEALTRTRVEQERDSLMKRLRIATFQLEELRPGAAPSGVKPRLPKALVRHRRLDIIHFGTFDRAERPRSAYFPKASAVLESSPPVLPALQELNTAAAILGRYYGLLDIFNLTETDVANLLSDKDTFRRSIEVKLSSSSSSSGSSLVDLLRRLRKEQAHPQQSENDLLDRIEALEEQLRDLRRKHKKALRDYQWDLRDRDELRKGLERCERTIEGMAREKAELYACVAKAETGRQEMEQQVGGLEHAVEAVSGTTLASTALDLTKRMRDLATEHVDTVRQLRAENGSLRRALAIESLQNLMP